MNHEFVTHDNQPTNPDQWVDLHGDYLYGYAMRRLRDADLVEELVQETFLAALQSRQKFAGQSSERTWLIGILKHKIVDRFRKSSREVPLDDAELLANEHDSMFRQTGEWVGHWTSDAAPKDWGHDPRAAMEKKEFWNTLDRCLGELPPRLAQVFILREVEELSTEEICQTLNISANNLWVMLHRARTQLRQSLEAGYFGQQTGRPLARQSHALNSSAA
jgi:RNA polymerase sigma-70 factor (ECF subfamily)